MVGRSLTSTKTTATSADPRHHPKMRAIASMPPAAPER